MLNGSRHTVLVLLPTAHGKSIILQTRVIASGATKQHKGICPFPSIINGQTAKARSPGIKHVSLFFFGKSLSTTDITPEVCCDEKGLQFSQEIGDAKIHTSIHRKLAVLFFAVSEVEMKNLQKSEQANFLVFLCFRLVAHGHAV